MLSVMQFMRAKGSFLCVPRLASKKESWLPPKATEEGAEAVVDADSAEAKAGEDQQY